MPQSREYRSIGPEVPRSGRLTRTIVHDGRRCNLGGKFSGELLSVIRWLGA